MLVADRLWWAFSDVCWKCKPIDTFLRRYQDHVALQASDPVGVHLIPDLANMVYSLLEPTPIASTFSYDEDASHAIDSMELVPHCYVDVMGPGFVGGGSLASVTRWLKDDAVGAGRMFDDTPAVDSAMGLASELSSSTRFLLYASLGGLFEPSNNMLASRVPCFIGNTKTMFQVLTECGLNLVQIFGGHPDLSAQTVFASDAWWIDLHKARLSDNSFQETQALINGNGVIHRAWRSGAWQIDRRIPGLMTLDNRDAPFPGTCKIYESLVFCFELETREPLSSASAYRSELPQWIRKVLYCAQWLNVFLTHRAMTLDTLLASLPYFVATRQRFCARV